MNLQDDFDTNLPNFFDGLLVSDSTLADGRRIVLFTSKESLRFLARSDCIAMDGTFTMRFRHMHDRPEKAKGFGRLFGL